MRNKVSRIVANPPWVRLSNIQEEQRKREMENAAKSQGLWVGGKNATGFDIAQLFVDKCVDLYLADGDKSGWVLPQAAILNGGNWARHIERHKRNMAETWDLGDLPFPKQFKACVQMVLKETSTKTKRLSLERKVVAKRPLHHDSWATVKEKTDWVEVQLDPPVVPSAWVDGKRAPARNGATLVPHCLVKIDVYSVEGDQVRFKTVQARHAPWKSLGPRSGTAPSHWVQDTIFNHNLLPYKLTDMLTKIIIPLDESKAAFDNSRNDNEYWRKAE